MSMAITNQTMAGNDADPSIQATVLLPDAGTVLTVDGMVKSPGLPWVTITGSPLVYPAVPGAGSTFWNIQVEGQTGAASVQSSASADPLPITPTSVVIFRQTLVAGESTDYALDLSATPDA